MMSLILNTHILLKLIFLEVNYYTLQKYIFEVQYSGWIGNQPKFNATKQHQMYMAII